jgi:phospholipase C
VRRLNLSIVVTAAAAFLACTPLASAQKAESKTKTPIKHFMVLMQENHTFDNYFGTYPGADGIPKGTCQRIVLRRPNRGCVKPFHLGDRAILDLGHSKLIFDQQYRGGRMDGFVDAHRTHTGRLDRNVMGYYDDRDLPYYWNIADNYILFDRFFTSAAAGSVQNHMYWVTGTPGNPEGESIPPGGFGDLPTIFDRLEEKKVSWKFYVQNYDPQITFRTPGTGDRASQILWAPLLAYARYLDNPRLHEKIVDLDEYFKDLQRGTLPSVAYIVPSGASEHPPGRIQSGQRFVRGLVNGLQRSPYWNSSAFMWTYDDWGGFYDHVRPPQVDRYGFGFRVPTLLVSSYAKRGHVDSTTLDFTSILKFIVHNWGLRSLSPRERKANNLLTAFDFERGPREPVFLNRDRTAPQIKEPRRPVIYVTYFLVLAVAGSVMGWAMWPATLRKLGREEGRRP